MDKKFTPITILLIEDNPAQEGIKSKDLKSRGIDIGNLDDSIAVPGINFKKEENKELHSLFVLKVLQHPEEIKEFISNCLEKENKEGSVALGGMTGVVPEIVEFDYKLSDNIQINREKGKKNEILSHIKYWTSYRKLREHYNPNFLFKSDQHLERKENGNYTEKDFIERINKKENATGNETWYKKDEQELANDELGLYAGVEVTRIFRNHVCIGIPVTSNFDVLERLHVFGKFYEWINDYDLGTMFSREERGNKDWDSVIAAAVKQLRIRIKTQIQTGKATPDYSQLIALAEGNIPDERIFSFETIYGKRNLPLDGLFIDKSNKVEPEAKDDFIQFVNEKKEALVKLNSKKEELEKTDGKNDEEKNKIKKKLDEISSSISGLSKKIEALENFNKNERNIEIWRFTNTILSHLPISISIIKKSSETSITLWNTYLNEFEDRIVLSDYSSRNGSLNTTETAYLAEVKKRLGVNLGTGLMANECSIKTLLQSEKDKNVKRLTFLIAVTNATIELEKQSVESNFNEKYAAFTTYEYVNVLFPKVNFKNSLLLPMNVTDKDKQTETERKWLSDNLSIDKSNKVTVGDIFQIEKWMLKGEKEILKLLFYNESKYFPQWLK
jgi:hypothetical protein